MHHSPVTNLWKAVGQHIKRMAPDRTIWILIYNIPVGRCSSGRTGWSILKHTQGVILFRRRLRKMLCFISFLNHCALMALNCWRALEQSELTFYTLPNFTCLINCCVYSVSPTMIYIVYIHKNI